MLRSLIISTLGRDKEGDYNPSFAKKLLRAAKEKPTHKFESKAALLKQLN